MPMTPEEVKKVNDLARSLKENKLAANIEEAMEMAKRMLLTESAGEKQTGHRIETEQKLSKLVENHQDKETHEEMKKADEEAVESQKIISKEQQELHIIKEEMAKDMEDLEKLKEDIEALKGIIEDAPAVAIGNTANINTFTIRLNLILNNNKNLSVQ